MRPHGLIVAFALGAIVVSSGCTRSERAELPQTGAGHAMKSHLICDAIESADALLAEHKTTWGEPRQVLRTGSNWYHIEYESNVQGAERVILVNPVNNHAEFPMRR